MSTENFNYDWTRFVKRVNINADADAIYKAWATQEGLEKWFLRQATFTTIGGTPRGGKELVQVGDTYSWLWHGWGDDTAEHGSILETNGVDQLKFIFGEAGTVTITIKTEQGQTIAELLQENIPGDEKGKTWYHLGCSTGWVFYMANLKSVLEGGIDLRNRNVELKNVITA